MLSSKTNPSYLEPQQEAELRNMLGSETLQVTNRANGGNSVVYLAEDEHHKWAVKSYPAYAPGKRDRLQAEASVYAFLNKHDVYAVPRMYGCNEELRWLIIDWIDGNIPESYEQSDINQALSFIQEVCLLSRKDEAKSLPQAAEACLSLSTLIGQLDGRLGRLQQLPVMDATLGEFLVKHFIPVFDRVRARAERAFQKNNIAIDVDLAQEKQSLIPADFGFHNTIKDANGQLYFFDFDYFGWDDPVKLLSDLLWHPKVDLSDDQEAQFINGISNIYQADNDFQTRFRYLHPLFGLRWALILLNEFIPEFWENRKHAAVYSDHEEAKRIQLDRAKQLLSKVQQLGSQL